MACGRGHQIDPPQLGAQKPGNAGGCSEKRNVCLGWQANFGFLPTTGQSSHDECTTCGFTERADLSEGLAHLLRRNVRRLPCRSVWIRTVRQYLSAFHRAQTSRLGLSGLDRDRRTVRSRLARCGSRLCYPSHHPLHDASLECAPLAASLLGYALGLGIAAVTFGEKLGGPRGLIESGVQLFGFSGAVCGFLLASVWRQRRRSALGNTPAEVLNVG
jgi:hypothetical protein